MNFDDVRPPVDEAVNGPMYVSPEGSINFDALKAKWDKEDYELVYIPQKIAHLKKAQHPLDKLKRNMRREIYLQISCLLFVAVAMLMHEENYILHAVSLLTVILISIISIFFLSKFYKFYQSVQLYNVETKDTLLELYYHLKLNMERYKSFTFLAMCSFMMHQGITLYSKIELIPTGVDQLIETPSNLMLLGYMVPLILSFLVVIVATNWWVDFFYGKYAKQIKEILDELKED